MTRSLLITVFMMLLALVSIDSFAQRESKRTQNRRELVKIYQHEQPQSELRAQVADRVRKAVADDVRVKPAEARSLLNQVGQR